MPLVDHSTGNYRFLPGIAPYSCGVVSRSGYEIARVTFQTPLPYRDGFDAIDQFLADQDVSRASLCAIELRSPKPFTFDGFARFNADYAEIHKSWGLFVDGVNPVARTNVAPSVAAPDIPSLYAFSFARPSRIARPTFVVAGAGELPEGILEAEGIVARGDLSAEGVATKARFVMDLMESRLHGLGGDWKDVTCLDVYTVHNVEKVVPEIVLGRVGESAIHGVQWFPSRPPIEEIEFEMDLRGVVSEIRLE